jgi:SRSO17 transposase
MDRSSWSADTLCERARSYAIEALGDPDGLLVADETGFLKKGHILSALHCSIPLPLDGSRIA